MAADDLSNNGLRNETGALIGGLIVEDYVAGIQDFKEGKPFPDVSSPSYDLGRQRAAEAQASDNQFKAWMAAEDARRDKAMRDLLPPKLYAEYRKQIDAIQAKT